MSPDDPRQVLRQINICKVKNWPQSFIPILKVNELIRAYENKGSGSWVVIGSNKEESFHLTVTRSGKNAHYTCVMDNGEISRIPISQGSEAIRAWYRECCFKATRAQKFMKQSYISIFGISITAGHSEL